MTRWRLYAEFDAADEEIDGIGDQVIAALPRDSVFDLEPDDVQDVKLLGDVL